MSQQDASATQPKRWRIGFETPEMFQTFTTRPTLTSPADLIADLTSNTLLGVEKKVRLPDGSKLILLQEVPIKATATRIRFCPFCGYHFDEDEAPEGMTELDCYDCGNSIDLGFSFQLAEEAEGEGADADAS